MLFHVIPAKAGIQCFDWVTNSLDPGFHRGDEYSTIFSQPPSHHGKGKRGFSKKKGGRHMETRKEFLEAVMKMANLTNLKEADDAARAVISLTKLIIGDELSQRIAEVSPPDLREGWESIRAAQMDDFERDELIFETGEVSEQ